MYLSVRPNVWQVKKVFKKSEITYVKGEANPGQLFSQIVQSLTPKYSVTNNLMQVTYKIFLSLNDRNSYTFETSK